MSCATSFLKLGTTAFRNTRYTLYIRENDGTWFKIERLSGTIANAICDFVSRLDVFEIIATVSFEHSGCASSRSAFSVLSNDFRARRGHRRTGKATLGRLVNPPLLVNPPVIPGRDASARGPLRRKRKKSYGRHESRIILGNRPR